MPQLSYVREPSNAPSGREKRFIAIAMSYDETGNVKYGASIFKRNDNKDTVIKKKLRETALQRLASRPVEFTSKDLKTQKDVVAQIRKTMYTKGVCCKKAQM